MDNRIERRGFLGGLFGGLVGSGVLVLASDHDIERFSVPLGEPLTVSAPAPPVGCGDNLYNARGELVAVVTNLYGVMSETPTLMARSVATSFEIGDRVRLFGRKP